MKTNSKNSPPPQTSSCQAFSDEMLTAYLDRRLPEKEREGLEAHLAECDQCLNAILVPRLPPEAENVPVPPLLAKNLLAAIAQERAKRGWSSQLAELIRASSQPFAHWPEALATMSMFVRGSMMGRLGGLAGVALMVVLVPTLAAIWLWPGYSHKFDINMYARAFSEARNSPLMVTPVKPGENSPDEEIIRDDQLLLLYTPKKLTHWSILIFNQHHEFLKKYDSSTPNAQTFFETAGNSNVFSIRSADALGANFGTIHTLFLTSDQVIAPGLENRIISEFRRGVGSPPPTFEEIVGRIWKQTGKGDWYYAIAANDYTRAATATKISPP
jgi:hypothetical protein